MQNTPINKKTWEEFRETGLLLYANSILHAFGWAVVVAINEKNEITDCYPARTSFRGFDSNSTSDSYKRIAKYLKENSEDLSNEIDD